MNRYAVYSALCFSLGIIIFIVTARMGEGSVYVLPFIFVGTGVGGVLSVLGGLCIIFGFMFAFVAFSRGRIELGGFDDLDDWSRGDGPQKRSGADGREGRPVEGPRRGRSSIKGGGVVLIGPIPIIFGSDQRLTIVLVILAIVIMVLAFLFMSGAFF